MEIWQNFGVKFILSQDGSPIPKELLSKLIASRRANAGGFNLRQIILGTFDQRIHTRGEADTQQMFADTYEEIIGFRPIDGTNMPASWGHMVGYDAQYYGYLVICVIFITALWTGGLKCTMVGPTFYGCQNSPFLGKKRSKNNVFFVQIYHFCILTQEIGNNVGPSNVYCTPLVQYTT